MGHLISNVCWDWEYVYMYNWNLPGKKFMKKNLQIKTLEKSPNFLRFLEKMSLEIKSCVLDSWNFFPKIVRGLPIKSQKIRSQELKP